ncbi:IS200/IS605 family transposase, partial [Mammaliicoccus sciuri]
QLQEDIVAEQLTMIEYIDPLTGEETRKKKK